MEIAQQCDIDNAMGQLAAALYGQHQQAGNGKRDFSSILQKLQKKSALNESTTCRRDTRRDSSSRG